MTDVASEDEVVGYRWRSKIKGEWMAWSISDIDPNDWEWPDHWDDMECVPLVPRRTDTAVVGEEALSECDILESCLETFWCITEEGSDNRLLAEGAIQSAKRLRELLSARTSTAPVAWISDQGRVISHATKLDWDASGLATGMFRPLFDSPPPPQPGARVTEEMVRAAMTAWGDAAGADGAQILHAASWMRAALTAALTASIPDSGEPG